MLFPGSDGSKTEANTEEENPDISEGAFWLD